MFSPFYAVAGRPKRFAYRRVQPRYKTALRRQSVCFLNVSLASVIQTVIALVLVPPFAIGGLDPC